MMERRNGGIPEGRTINPNRKRWIVESRNGGKSPQIVKDGIAEQRNGGKFPDILKDEMTENAPKSQS